MKTCTILEMKSDQVELYKKFFGFGLTDAEESFRITSNDDANAPFPTKDKEDSFTLAAFVDDHLGGIVSFERDGYNREKLMHKGILFRMYVSKNFRGKGIGKALIEELLERVKKLGTIEQINLTVIANNETAKGSTTVLVLQLSASKKMQ